MAQTDQQLQNGKDVTVTVHFRWMGSNAPIASLEANDSLFYSDTALDDLYSLRKWLAPKLGSQPTGSQPTGSRPTQWYQVTLYSGNKRLTHDVLLGVYLSTDFYDDDDDSECKLDFKRRAGMMPHIGRRVSRLLRS
jgi:hypothetical protein